MATARSGKMPGVQVADVKKTIPTCAKVYKCRLYPGLNIYYLASVNISDVAAQTRPFEVQLFKAASLNYRYPALFALEPIYKHLSCHFRIPQYLLFSIDHLLLSVNANFVSNSQYQL
jgi:hypothetical protein